MTCPIFHEETFTVVTVKLTSLADFLEKVREVTQDNLAEQLNNCESLHRNHCTEGFRTNFRLNSGKPIEITLTENGWTVTLDGLTRTGDNLEEIMSKLIQ